MPLLLLHLLAASLPLFLTFPQTCGHSQSGHLLLLSTHFPPNPVLSRLVLSSIQEEREREREIETGDPRKALGLSPLPYLPTLP
ncbi:hypothetical protein BDP55DRAFT_237691 [Colletotrichum godetiae]|uniref:Uncharacterized protein n=1 Tax=Colletotrichum godetiae TaxID=1209918 RepID=A0AAJ0AFM8_9PEZI|nr:uncharacterized protein BDP55DRAFT_237691 [Colletotrichum godetiae]KAK1673005.1 hypothetical protein BDP55DRAFT_237691 [Colletotrichum godetiae]